MHSVYVLRSLRNGKRYVGFTYKDPALRTSEHNKGSNAWSKQNRPFELIYTEEYAEKRAARQRELFLKSTAGRRWLDEKLRACSSVG